MHFVLIIAFLTSTSMGGTQGVTMQEFDTKTSCEAAGARAREMAASLRGDEDAQHVHLALACMPK